MRERIKSADQVATARLLSLDDACKRYSLGRMTMRQAAEDASAIVRLGWTVRFSVPQLDRYFDSLTE